MALIKFDEIIDGDNFEREANKIITLLGNIKKEVNNISEVAKSFATLSTEVKKSAKESLALSSSMSTTSENVTKLEQSTEQLIIKQKAANESQRKTTASIKSAAEPIKKNINSIKALKDEYKTASDERKRGIIKTLGQEKKATQDLNNAIRNASKEVGIAKNSYKDFENKLAKAKDTLRKMPNAFDSVTGKLNKSNKAAVRASAEVKRYDNALRQADGTLKQSFRNVGNYGASVKGALGDLTTRFLGIAAAAAAVSKAFQFTIRVNREFDKSLKNLSAITGAVGKDLEFFESQAKLIGVTSQTSAKDALEAFKLVGSGAPELLKTKDALVAVTKEALILSEASGLSLPEAAKALTETLNQLQIPTSEAGRVINVLAAASQKGAKEVPFINEALAITGTAATSAGASLEEVVAAIELVGKEIPQASKVGTGLRNVFTKLRLEAAKQGREFRGLKGELDLLAPSYDDVTKLTNIFGLENLNTAQILIRSKDDLDDFTKSISDTSTAYQQAATNNDTLDASLNRLNNTLEVAVTTGGFAKFLKGTVDLTASAISGLSEVDGLAFSIFGNAKDIAISDLRKSLDAQVQEQKDFIDKLGQLNKVGRRDLLEELKINAKSENELEALKAKSQLSILIKFTNDKKKLLLEQSLLEKNLKEENNDEEQKEKQITATGLLKEQIGELNKVLIEQSLEGDINNDTLAEYLALTDKLEQGQKKLKDAIDGANDAIFKTATKIDAPKIGGGELITTFKGVISDKDVAKGLAKRRKFELQEEESFQDARNQIIASSANDLLGLLGTNSGKKLALLEQEQKTELEFAGKNGKLKEDIENKFATKKAEIKRKEAIAEKIGALFSIAISTAINAARVSTNIPLLALVIAQGALQAGIVAAKPIPQVPAFAKGRKGGEFLSTALVGEAGREIYKDNKTGEVRLIDKPTLMPLAQGSDVIKNSETEKILSGQVIKTEPININKEPQKDSLSAKVLREVMNEALGNIKTTEIHRNERGASVYERTKGLRVNRLDKRYNF
jgi:TP901 family phage tail tape measure protein